MKVNELKKEFESIILPKTFTLQKGINIIDCQKFVMSHIKILEANPGNKRFMPYYERLLKFYLKLQK